MGMDLLTNAAAAGTATAERQEPEGFLTTDQLLERLPISRRTLSNHRKAGLIPAVKLGDRVLFHWKSVEAALLRRQRGGAE